MTYAATAIERFHRLYGRYDQEALDPQHRGYRKNPNVDIDVHVSGDGQTYCLEGNHADSSRVFTWDPTDGLVREGTCDLAMGRSLASAAAAAAIAWRLGRH